MVRIRQTATFKRALKRLQKQHKAELDIAVRAIAQDPSVGESKLGDLAGVRIYKFKMNQQTVLLAYAFFEADDAIKLLALGSHENFYRDLKR